MTDDQPNILFLFSDQHAQHVAGCYGDEIAQTPALDRLAAEGVTFENAYTTSPLCTPARMAMLTAQYSHRIGCWTNSDILASDLPTHAHSLALPVTDQLSSAGCTRLAPINFMAISTAGLAITAPIGSAAMLTAWACWIGRRSLFGLVWSAPVPVSQPMR